MVNEVIGVFTNPLPDLCRCLRITWSSLFVGHSPTIANLVSQGGLDPGTRLA